MQLRSDLIHLRVFRTVTLMQRSFHLVVGTALSHDDGIFFAFSVCVMMAMDLIRHNGTLVRLIDIGCGLSNVLDKQIKPFRVVIMQQ